MINVPPLADTPDDAPLGWRPRLAFNGRRRIPSREARQPFDVDQRTVIVDGRKLVNNLDPPATVAEYEFHRHTDDPLNLIDVVAGDLSPQELHRLRSLGYLC